MVNSSMPAGGAGGLSEFFRYHGLWAPGVRLFRRLGFSAKALVISAAFVLPLAVLAWSYFGDKRASIEFSAKERLGVAYARALFPVIDLMQQQREQRPAAGDLSGALARLSAADGAAGAELGTSAAQRALQDAAKAALPDGAAGAKAAGERIAAAIDLLGASTDGSNLTLDPDIDTYYLMDASMFRLVPMAEAVWKLRALGRQALADHAIDAGQRRAAIEAAADLRSNALAVKAGLAKAIAYNADLRKDGDPAAALAAVDRLLAAADGLLGETPQGDAPDFAARAIAAADAIVALRGKATDELDRLIAVRVDGQTRARNVTAALLAVSLLAVVYLFMSFRRVLDGGLREVAFHINAMRDGDLTTSPRPWGADEAARLMTTLVDMQHSLREIVGQVRSASDSIVHASAEIATGSNDLSARTERSAANLQQSASAMEQISATIDETVRVARQAADAARVNADSAQRGGEAIATMAATMHEIQAASNRIGDIIGTIDGIAFQTNILALNAAVEAARAGEAGRGFAVVAAEVRQLAQRAAAAAREIKGLVGASIEKVDAGSSMVASTRETIGRIVSESGRVDGLIAEISRGTSEQATGVKQTTLAVQEMDAATQQNAALVEQTAAAAASLTDQARSLASRVARFRLA